MKIPHGHVSYASAQVSDLDQAFTVGKIQEQIRAFDEQVWRSRRGDDIVLITTLLYTG